MSQRKIIPPEILLECYRRNEGNKRATARELGVDKDTIRKCLALYGADTKPVVGGTVRTLKHNVLPLPPKGKVFRYLLTSAQSNTKAFVPFLRNLEAYAGWLGDCRIMVSRFTYNRNAFHNPAVSKAGYQTVDPGECWFDSLLDAYVVDDPSKHGTCRWQLAPDLWYVAEFQIEPTATTPLSGLGTLTGTDSCIFPHVKVALEAVPSLLTNKNPYAKHVYTTGTVTGRNYIKRKAGLKAEFHHSFAALIVEVSSSGSWWVRQLAADSKGYFHDCPNGNVVKVADGQVSSEGNRLEAITWGDVHVTDLPAEREVNYWGKTDGTAVIDMLKPKYQFFHDVFSFRSRSHHEMKSFGKMFQKHINGVDLVDKEVQKTADFLSTSERAFCISVTVNSNHDRHLEKYLDEVNYKHDLPNVVFFLKAQLDRVLAIQRGEPWIALEYAMREAGCPESIKFLATNESFVICAKSGHPIECALHGDIGANGSRGSTMNLAKAGARISKGHDHTAGIRDGVWSGGTCAEKQGYNENGGLTTWSVSHIFTYSSGKRSLVMEKEGRLWA